MTKTHLLIGEVHLSETSGLIGHHGRTEKVQRIMHPLFLTSALNNSHFIVQNSLHGPLKGPAEVGRC